MSAENTQATRQYSEHYVMTIANLEEVVQTLRQALALGEQSQHVQTASAQRALCEAADRLLTAQEAEHDAVRRSGQLQYERSKDRQRLVQCEHELYRIQQDLEGTRADLRHDLLGSQATSPGLQDTGEISFRGNSGEGSRTIGRATDEPAWPAAGS